MATRPLRLGPTVLLYGPRSCPAQALRCSHDRLMCAHDDWYPTHGPDACLPIRAVLDSLRCSGDARGRCCRDAGSAQLGRSHRGHLGGSRLWDVLVRARRPPEANRAGRCVPAERIPASVPSGEIRAFAVRRRHGGLGGLHAGVAVRALPGRCQGDVSGHPADAPSLRPRRLRGSAPPRPGHRGLRL
jgi:hypothetical protein